MDGSQGSGECPEALERVGAVFIAYFKTPGFLSRLISLALNHKTQRSTWKLQACLKN
jgi:hypothetical protein